MKKTILSELCRYIDASPSPYHAVSEAAARLEARGFSALAASERWEALAPGGYFTITGDSALIAFVVPVKPGARGFRIVGAHSDSPNLRLKPNPEYTTESLSQWGVEVYGGALLNSWLDRDLGLSGRVLVRGKGKSQTPETKLFRIDAPVARVPQLAIHLDRDISERGLKLNRQTHMPPVVGIAGRGTTTLHALVAKSARVAAAHIVGIDAMLHDLTPATAGGIDGEFLFAARLDNLAMCHAAITALPDPKKAPPGVVPVAVLFDHEEVGSQSMGGAGSALLPRVLERIVLGMGGDSDDVHRVIAGSLCVSADMAHAVHPNYADRHDPRHRPRINGGPVIKINAQQRYATSVPMRVLFESLAEAARVPVQLYAHRTDLPCGSTIGPITATKLGIPTVDVGNAMLSMHSAREMGGTRDPELMVRVLEKFYAHARAL